MKNILEFKGEWFLPSEKENRVYGILSYDPEAGSTLEVIGRINDGNVNFDKDVIFGITTDSKYITLYKYFVSHRSLTFKNSDENVRGITIYRINEIIEGGHVEDPTNLKLEKIIVEFDNFSEWINISGFVRNDVEIESSNLREVKILYEQPKNINFNITESILGEFNFLFQRSGRKFFDTEQSVFQDVELILSSDVEGFTLREAMKNIFIFQDFLILGLYQSTHLSSIKMLVHKNKSSNQSNHEMKLYIRIPKNNESKRTYHDILFTYKDIEVNFQKVIKNWYEKYEMLEPAFNLLIEQFYNKNKFTNNTFLNLAQAAETYHSRVNNHTKIPKQDYKLMKEKILNSADPKFHGWLKDQFSFGNNLNLQTRLEELCEKYSNETLKKIIPDPKVFIKSVKDSRNYYTHYSNNGKKKALQGNDLYVLSEKLKVLLLSAFLIETGFDVNVLATLLKKKEYIYFSHILKK